MAVPDRSPERRTHPRDDSVPPTPEPRPLRARREPAASPAASAYESGGVDPMSTMRWSVWVAAGAMSLGLLAGGCATAAPGPASAYAEKSAPAEDGPMVQVHNRHWQDVNVYLLIGGTRYRLGTVSTSQTARFGISRFAGWDTHAMQIFVDPIGSTDSYTSESFTLADGQWADLVVEGTLALSNYMVKNY